MSTVDKHAAELVRQVAAAFHPAPRRQYRFNPRLSYRFALAWPAWKFAIEIEGRRHNLAKHQAGWMAGWQVLRVSTRQVRSGAALEFIRSALDTQ